MFIQNRRVHFVGIGGIGMSGIAEVLHNLGHQVSGSDLRASDITSRLASLGVRVYTEHAAAQVEGAHVVVVSSAVRPDNVEVEAARRAGIPVISRAEMLAELMRLKLGVAVAGAHGKTTVTSMVAKVLSDAGLDPTIVNGGRLAMLGSSSRLGQGDVLVAEADESDRSFLRLTPIIAVATNLDEEHMESYADMEDMARAYEAFLSRVPFYGVAIVNLEDAYLARIAGQLARPTVGYAIEQSADLVARKLKLGARGLSFELERRGDTLGRLELAVPGRHNVLNALAAAAAAFALGLRFADIAASLGGFEGAERRFQHKGERAGVRVVDDYAHHPREIAATLGAARDHHAGRIVAVFQPHRYSRVQRLSQDFARSFDRADVVVATEIYPAGEPPIEGVCGHGLAEAIRASGHPEVRFVSNLDELAPRLAALVRPGDLVITLGAGSITRVGAALLELLAAP